MGIMFKRDMLDLVLAGKKTQTRRKVDEQDTIDEDQLDIHHAMVNALSPKFGVSGVSVVGHVTRTHSYFVRQAKCGLVYRNDRAYWRVGNTYAVQPGRGKKSDGRVVLTGIRLERFIDISQADAEAEGFDSPEGFFAKIKSIYGDDFDLEQPCWVLEFKLVTA